MSEERTPEDAAVNKKSHLFNWISLAGIYLIVVTVCASIFLFLVEWQLQHTNVYLGIILFMVMPALVGLGLTLLFGGIFIEKRRRKKNPEGASQINLSLVKHRKILFASSILGSLLMVMSLYGAYRSFHWTESRAFCGEVCHEVMSPEFTAHQHSPHSQVDCVTCHIGPGPEHFVKSKTRGLYQVYSVAAEKFDRPIPTPLEHLRPAREICEQCHRPDAFFASVLREHVYFLTDEDNSRFNTAMLIHVGGGAAEKMGASGQASGIHWHMALENETYYIATDKQLQEIPWVKMIYKDGREVVFMDEESEYTEEELLSKFEMHKMDCIDCHNRSVHQFGNPQRLLNSALLLGRISPELPYIKKRGLELLGADYATQEEGRIAIKEKLTSFYQEEYPELLESKKAEIDQAIAEIQGLFSSNMFPEMKANWKAHPDNIGHMFENGCFRCHDDKHTSKGGETITKDCRVCHDIIAQGLGNEKPPITGSQEYQHPEDIMGLWQDSSCTECHTGAGAVFE